MSSYSLAPYIESYNIFENDSDGDSLIDSLDINLTINGSGLSSPSDYLIEGPLYKESSDWGPPEDITWAWEEDDLRDLDSRKDIILQYSKRLESRKSRSVFSDVSHIADV